MKAGGYTGKEQAATPELSAPGDKSPSIGDVVTRFTAEIDSLADTLPLAMRSISAALHDARQELHNFARENATKQGKNADGGDVYRITADHVLRFQRLSRRAERTKAASVLVPRSMLVALISQYDSFLGALIEVLFLARPEILNGSDRALSFAELVGFGSISAARAHIVEKEVESVLRRSHGDQFDWLESKFSVKLRQNLSVWPSFIEVTERRNLFVHTGGQVSAQYLDICRTHKIDCSKSSAEHS